MDVATLAKDVAAFLTPFLPYLLKAGETAAEGVWGQAAWESVKALWGKLRPKVEARPAAQEAAQELADHPDDEDAQAALRLQLRKILAEDEVLAAEVAQLWEKTKAMGVTVIASGEHSVAAREIEGSVIVTGDQNVVQQGKYSVNVGEARGIVLGNQAVVNVNIEGTELLASGEANET